MGKRKKRPDDEVNDEDGVAKDREAMEQQQHKNRKVPLRAAKKISLKTIGPKKSDKKSVILAFEKQLEKEATIKREREVEQREKHRLYAKEMRNMKKTAGDLKIVDADELEKKKEAHKKANAESQKQKSNRGGSKLCMVERVEEFGSYIEITDIPYHIMAGLIQNFQTYEFDKKFDHTSANISAGHEESLKNSSKSMYWFLDCPTNSDAPDFEYTNNKKILNPLQIQLLTQLKNLIIGGVRRVLKDETLDWEFYRPALLRTGEPRHQVLHLDSREANFDDPYDALIVHFPLESCGQWLRLGKVVQEKEDIKLIHKLIYIPFGTGVILPATQLHVGHYGNEYDQRFHAVISRSEWKRSYLELLESYIKKRFNHKKAGEIYLDFHKYQNDTPVQKEMESVALAGQKRIGSNYATALSDMYDYPIFHTCMSHYKTKYGRAHIEVKDEEKPKIVKVIPSKKAARRKKSTKKN